MFKKIDRYIIGKYLSTFFFTILLITMIAIVIDFSEKIGKFIDESLSAKQIFFDYYLHFVPWINGLLWPLFALIAVIFFTSRLAKQSEIISILGAGVSYHRILVPYLTAAMILASALWVGNNYVIPISTKKKNNFENTYIWRSNKRTLNEHVHFYLNPNEKAYVRYFRQRDTSMQDFRVETYEEGKLVKLMKAKRVTLEEPPNKWKIEDYTIREISGLDEDIVIGKGMSIDTVLNITPDDFIRYINQMEMMTTPELRAFINYENQKGLGKAKKFVIELHRRTADPFTILILTIIGFAVASRKVRGGIGLHLALGIVIGSAFVITSKFSQTIAYSNAINPALGIWIPNILFSFIAIYFLVRAQK